MSSQHTCMYVYIYVYIYIPIDIYIYIYIICICISIYRYICSQHTCALLRLNGAVEAHYLAAAKIWNFREQFLPTISCVFKRSNPQFLGTMCERKRVREGRTEERARMCMCVCVKEKEWVGEWAREKHGRKSACVRVCVREKESEWGKSERGRESARRRECVHTHVRGRSGRKRTDERESTQSRTKMGVNENERGCVCMRERGAHTITEFLMHIQLGSARVHKPDNISHSIE